MIWILRGLKIDNTKDKKKASISEPQILKYDIQGEATTSSKQFRKNFYTTAFFELS